MNRLVRGSVMLAATLVVLSACGGDPTANNADKPVKVVTDPTVLFVANTDSQAVTVELQNSLGQQLAADFAVANVGAGLTVTRDTTFAVVSGGVNPTKARFFVRPTTPSSFVASSFDLTAGGLSTTIPVKITPSNLPGVFSNLTPNAQDTITITAPAPMSFSAGSTVTFGGVDAFVTNVAADGSTISFVPIPGSPSGTAVVTGVVLPYLASAQTLTTTDQVTIPSYGTGDPATAPTVVLPATGATTTIFDAGSGFSPNATCTGTLGGSCLIYKLVLPVGASYQVTATWENTTDLGIYFFNSTFSGLVGTTACDSHGNGATGQPETCTLTLPAGTYYMVDDTFSAFYASPDDVDPTWIKIDITGL